MKNFVKKDGTAAQWFTNATATENLASNGKIRRYKQSGHTYLSNPTYTNLMECGARIIASGNDAPRGGKLGEWATFELTGEMTAIVTSIEAERKSREQSSSEKAIAYSLACEDLEIHSEIRLRAEKRAEMLAGKVSNKVLRKIAHNIAASVIGSYGSRGMEIAFDVLKNQNL